MNDEERYQQRLRAIQKMWGEEPPKAQQPQQPSERELQRRAYYQKVLENYQKGAYSPEPSRTVGSTPPSVRRAPSAEVAPTERQPTEQVPPSMQQPAEQVPPFAQQPSGMGQPPVGPAGGSSVFNSALFKTDEDLMNFARGIARNVPEGWMQKDIEQNGEAFLAAIKQNPDLLLMIAQAPQEYGTLRDLFGLGGGEISRSFPLYGYPTGGVGPLPKQTQEMFPRIIDMAKNLAFERDDFREDLKKYPHAFELLGSYHDFLPMVEMYPNWYPVLRKAFELWEQRYNSGAPENTNESQ